MLWQRFGDSPKLRIENDVVMNDLEPSEFRIQTFRLRERKKSVSDRIIMFRTNGFLFRYCYSLLPTVQTLIHDNCLEIILNWTKNSNVEKSLVTSTFFLDILMRSAVHELSIRFPRVIVSFNFALLPISNRK